MSTPEDPGSGTNETAADLWPSGLRRATPRSATRPLHYVEAGEGPLISCCTAP